MRTRTNGEARERLRQLLHQHGRRLGLTPAAIDLLVRHAVLDRWGPGDEIVAHEDGHDLALLLVVGAAKIVCSTSGGPPVVVCHAAPGQLIAIGGSVDGRVARPWLTAIAADPLGTIVARWGQSALVELLASLAPAAVLQLMCHGWRGLSSLLRQKCDLLALPLRGRVLAVLRTLARDFGTSHEHGVRIDVRLRHADVAAMAVGSRANVTRALEQLRREGLVVVERQRFVVSRASLDASAPAERAWRDAVGYD